MIASGEPLWYLFHRAMTEPLGRTAAYAFLADVLRKTRKEQEWSVHFSSWFRGHFKTLSEVGLKEELMGLRGDISPYVNFRKNQLLKILIAACTFDVLAAESPAQRSPITREIIATDNAQRVNMAIATMESLSEVLYLMWKVDADGSLPSICAEVSEMFPCTRLSCHSNNTNSLSYHRPWPLAPSACNGLPNKAEPINCLIISSILSCDMLPCFFLFFPGSRCQISKAAKVSKF